MKKTHIALSVLPALMLAGCGGGYDSSSGSSESPPAQTTDTPAAQPSEPSAGETPAAVSFSGGVQPIFSSNCAFAGCHAGGSPAAGQDLSEGKSFTSIVGVAARSSCVGTPRVNPGNPDASALVKKIEGTSCGTRMPKGREPLSADKITLIRAWIQQGAPNN